MPEQEKLSQAIAVVQSLDVSVSELAKEVAATKSDVRKEKRFVRWLSVSFLADIVITVAIAFGGYTIQVLQNEQTEETELTRTNQCALVNLFIQFEKSSVNNPNLSLEEKRQRVASFVQIHKIHDDLRCPGV